jgi:hypothetical protein
MPITEEHKKLKDLMEDHGLDFDIISKITGHSRDSVRSMLAPGKPIPRWVKLAIHINENQKLLT